MRYADRLPDWERRAFIQARGMTCVYCGIVGDRWAAGGKPWHIDHTTPRTRGGGGRNREDLALSCATCNGLKGERFPEELPDYLPTLARKRAFVQYADHIAAILARRGEWLTGAA